MGDEVTITYETIFEILRREKGREELQKLEPLFFEEVASYLREKVQVMSQSTINVFSEDEKEKTDKQLSNIKKMLRELYDRREKKIMEMAVIKAKTSSNIIDITTLLPEEKKLYDDFVSLLNFYRKGLLLNMLEARLPVIDKAEEPKEQPLAEQKEKKRL